MPKIVIIQKAGPCRVGIRSRGGILELRWTFQGRQRSKSLGVPDGALGRSRARKIVAQMDFDLISGNFDPSLEKYLGTPGQSTKIKHLEFSEAFERIGKLRVERGQVGLQRYHSTYVPLENHLKRFGRISCEKDAINFIRVLGKTQCPPIVAQSLSLLKGCERDCLADGVLSTECFAKIKPPRFSQADTMRDDHLEPEEIIKFLEVVRAHPIYKHYGDFCEFAFKAGLRPSELIGLRWCDIDMVKGTLHIAEVLGRGPKGESSGKKRERRETKNCWVRRIKLPASCLEILEQRALQKTGDKDLVFLSSKGNPMDDRNFIKYCLKTCLGLAELRYVQPYTTRHGTIRRLSDAGHGPHAISAVMGHSPEMTLRYGRSAKLLELPDF